MDKGLKKINELKRNLNELETKKLENDESVERFAKKKMSLDTEIYELENKIYKLNNEKKERELAPKQRKIEKKELIISFIVSCLVTLAMTSFVTTFILGGISVFYSIGFSSVVAFILFAVVLPLEFKFINKKYPVGNLDKIENNILESNVELEFFKNKRNDINRKLIALKENKTILEKQIAEIIQSLNSVSNLRNEVIEEILNNNNPELDKKSEETYDNFGVKQKVK